jgi:hypothetical protein
MRLKWISIAAVVAAIAGGGVAVASHVPQVDPATVPTGFLAAHSSVSEVSLLPFVRALRPNGVDVFVQHAKAPTGWHTHPGPAIVEVVSGALTYEEVTEPSFGRNCRRTTYGTGQGFVDPGFGHVHRAIAGSSGADFYVVYLLPRGSTTHIIPVSAPPECTA